MEEGGITLGKERKGKEGGKPAGIREATFLKGWCE